MQRDQRNRRRRGTAATATLLAVLAGAPPAARSQDAPPDDLEQPPPQGHVFRNHFWVNLHHFLYLQGLTAEREGALEDAPPAWMDAVEYYRSTLVSRDLLFDRGMRRIDVLLGGVRRRADLEGLDLPEGLADVLGETGPLYLARYWPLHEQRNAEWIRTTSALLDAHGQPVSERLSEVLVSQWPTSVLVDVLVYANWAGAYTSSGPDHVRIGTAIPSHETPPEAFETFYHETSHLMADTVGDRIGRAAERLGAEVPRDLWHTILFFTVGEIVRHSPATPDDYVPYAERHGLYERSPAWSRYRDALREHWLPYMAGELTMDEALEAIVARLERERPGDAGPR